MSAEPGRGQRLLIVTAVAAEAAAVVRGAARALGHPRTTTGTAGGYPCVSARSGDATRVDVVTAGVGPAAAAAATAAVLAVGRCRARPYAAAVSAGIAGGFAAAAPGTAVLADAIVAADLGATTPQGFADVSELGFGTVRHLPPAAAVAAAERAAAAAGLRTAVGTVLTVSATTGTAERAAELAARHPAAVGEAMEGFGVAEAAAVQGVPVLELRTVSNPVGPRDRAAWRIGEALEALEALFAAVLLRAGPPTRWAVAPDGRRTTPTDQEAAAP